MGIRGCEEMYVGRRISSFGSGVGKLRKINKPFALISMLRLLLSKFTHKYWNFHRSKVASDCINPRFFAATDSSHSLSENITRKHHAQLIIDNL